MRHQVSLIWVGYLLPQPPSATCVCNSFFCSCSQSSRQQIYTGIIIYVIVFISISTIIQVYAGFQFRLRSTLRFHSKRILIPFFEWQGCLPASISACDSTASWPSPPTSLSRMRKGFGPVLIHFPDPKFRRVVLSAFVKHLKPDPHCRFHGFFPHRL